MRKFLISAAVAAAAMTAAVPAAAQYAPRSGYGHGYNNNNNYGSRQLLNRIERIKDQINMLDRRNILSNREADRLKGQANDLRRLVQRIDNNGVDRRERANIEVRIAALENRVQRQARDWNRR